MTYDTPAPTRLHLERQPGGDVIAVGLSSGAGVFVQEYWAEGRARYAVTNVSTTTVMLTVSEWHGHTGPRLLGPWRLAPCTVASYDVQVLVQRRDLTLLAVGLDGQPTFGLLRTPALPGPPPVPASRAVLSVEGLNGIGGRGACLWLAQDTLVFAAGKITVVRLYVPGATRRMSIGQPAPPQGLSAVFVRRVEAPTLTVEHESGVAIVTGAGDAEPLFHELTLELRLPEAPTPMAALMGRVTSPSGGFSFARGLLMQPPVGA